MKTTVEILLSERQRVDRFQKATAVQVLWKGDELVRYQGALLTVGLLLRADGIHEFGPDEVPEALKPQGQGIAGTAIGMLTKGDAPLLVPFFGTIPDRAIYHGRRTSLSESRNGAKVFLYVLGQHQIVEAWLTGHGFNLPKPQPQKELCLA